MAKEKRVRIWVTNDGDDCVDLWLEEPKEWQAEYGNGYYPCDLKGNKGLLFTIDRGDSLSLLRKSGVKPPRKGTQQRICFDLVPPKKTNSGLS